MNTGLLMALLPLVPSLIDSVFKIVGVIKASPETPEEIAKQLDAISADLKRVSALVAAVELPVIK